MNVKIYIFSVNDLNTTAYYFKKASQQMGYKVVYLTKNFNTKILKPNDIFLYIDPVKDFPFFLEKATCRTAAYFIDVHLGLEQRLIFSNFFDYLFIAQKDYVEVFKKYRKLNNKTNNKKINSNNIKWLPLACDPDVHFKKGLKRKIDVSFIGQINKLTSRDRHNVIHKVLKNFKTNNYKKFYKNIEMGKIYSSSKIIFNKSVNNDLNMRFFEGICSGGLLVTDKIKNGVNDLFLNKFHYIRYNSAKDAIHKINYYLKNEKDRKLIAEQGQKLAMKLHTYKHRLVTILNLISQKKYENNFSAAPIKNLNNQNVSLQYAKVFFILTKPFKIAQLMFIYNFNMQIFFLFFKSVLKYLNSIVPMTPGAIRIKFLNVCKF
jgi:hypothetical protein